MKKIALFFYLFFPIISIAQADLAHLKRKSTKTFVYKINAALAEKYITKDSINVDDYLPQQPFRVFNSDSINEDELPKGLYVLLSVRDNFVVADLTGISDLDPYTINNRQQLQIFIRNKDGDGDFIKNAAVWVNKKSAAFNASTGSYWVHQKKLDEAIVKIYTPADTTFISLMADDEQEKSINKQRWFNFLHTKTITAITWLPKKIILLFKKPEYYHYTSQNITAEGRMVFNQPKYKTTDTVKLKAYVFNRKWRRYRKPVNVYLKYYANGQHEQLLASLKPKAAGSFIYEFPLSDTLVKDTRYSVEFKTKKHNKKVISADFKIEDYLLDEVTNYNLRSSKETIYEGDTLHIYASATDANGLSLLDAGATLIITTTSIKSFFKDSVQVPDTLFKEEKKLLTEGETVFIIPTNNFPDANFGLNANLVFKNSNNEIQDKDETIDYRAGNKEILALNDNDTIRAEYLINNKSVTAKGLLKKDAEESTLKEISYPFKSKLDPLASGYTFYVINEGKKTDSFSLDIDDSYNIGLNRISAHDTLGFELVNTKHIPVTYSVWYGNKLINAATSEDATIKWATITLNKHKIYTVRWQYYYAGKEQARQETIALLYKLLNIRVNSNTTVFPGQKDTISIEVKDYKNKPVANANLTAVSYNSQFSKDINVREPPYLVKYRSKHFIQIDKFEKDDGYIAPKYPLGKHTKWITKFGLDSMPYYQALFPAKEFLDLVTPVADFTPQVSVHVVKQGIKQAIYLLYINRNLAFYNNVTDYSREVYPVYPGYIQFVIRLYDRLITLDSVYMQPNYKHDIFIDLDHLPANVHTEPMPEYFTGAERNTLENSLWMLNANTTNYAYIWNNKKLFHLSGRRQHIVGPFTYGDSLHFFAPGDFDIHFRFEAGYEYSLSPKIYRLEKKPVFNKETVKVYLPKIYDPQWIIADTMEPFPEIKYETKAPNLYLKTSNYNEWTSQRNSNGKIQFTLAKDTVASYIILFSLSDSKPRLVLLGNHTEILRITPGYYSLVIVLANGKALQTPPLLVEDNKTLCIHTDKLPFVYNNKVLADVIKQQDATGDVVPKITEKTGQKDSLEYSNQGFYENGSGIITGKVIDAKGGLPIPFSTITIKGTRNGTTADASGMFSIKNIHAGKYILVAMSIGYVSKEIEVNASNYPDKMINIALSPSMQHLMDVVVTGYGSVSRKELTGSVSIIHSQELSGALQGKVAGLAIGEPGSFTNITLRGTRSITSSNNPVYIVDGIFYDQLPANVSPDMIGEMVVLQSAEAIAIYGDRASQGAIVITTKTKTVRNQFRDYAFWQPQLFTDHNGKASFAVTYPDNVTGWRTFLLAMDKKRHMGKTETFIRAYKPLLTELSEPQFLIEGDSVSIIGKALNYSGDDYQLHTTFHSGSKSISNDFLLKGKASQIQKFALTAAATDSIKAGFSLQTSTGFKDAEERTIPVYKSGTEEANGKFYVLSNDTTINYTTAKAGSVELFVQNNTLDLLLQEIEYLKKYPYYCMEQTSSKLKGLLMEKKIKELTKRPFEDEKMIDFLLKKIEQAQLFSGGWPWWPNGNPDIYITNYVINALIPLRDNPLIEISIRNGLLFLQNNLPELNKDQLLRTLTTMSKAGHSIDYSPWTSRIQFDSLSLDQQWLFIQLKQRLKLEHISELQHVMKAGITGILGGLHWGQQTSHWYNTTNSTTIQAFEVLLHEKDYQPQLQSIVQYFLEQRTSGHWINTVESAGIISSILPYVLSVNNNFTQPSVVNINGDTSFTINQFPYKKTFTANAIHSLAINKQGGGTTYLTLYQKSFNNNPEAVDNYFRITSSFQENQQHVAKLKAGEKCIMKVDVSALKDAEYVMIEIPIPAGCTYSAKNQDEPNMHKEFFKNKVIIFSEYLAKGDHQFQVELESRYDGTFALNPAKVSLMYFPIFYGRNEIKKIAIE